MPDIVFVPDASVSRKEDREKFARTHAIRNSLRQKRLSQDRFKAVDPTATRAPRGKKNRTFTQQAETNVAPAAPLRLVGSAVDPFNVLPMNSERLTALMTHGISRCFPMILSSITDALPESARTAGRPVFSINHEAGWQHLDDVFMDSLQDPGVVTSVGLSIAFSINGGVLDRECEQLRLQAIRSLQHKVQDIGQAATSATIGAILLLVGVEGKLGGKQVAQAHLDGVQSIIQTAASSGFRVCHRMKRAISWQDLDTAVLTGTRRIISHDTFPELHWQREIPSKYICPPGFKRSANLLGAEFLEIAADMDNFKQSHQRLARNPDSETLTKLDNQQLWLESRCLSLQQHPETSRTLSICVWAAYACTYRLLMIVWHCDTVPARLSMNILSELQLDIENPIWDEHADLLLFVVHIGVLCADAEVKAQYRNLVASDERLTKYWMGPRSELVATLTSFLWCDTRWSPLCEGFWRSMTETWIRDRANPNAASSCP